MGAWRSKFEIKISSIIIRPKNNKIQTVCENHVNKVLKFIRSESDNKFNILSLMRTNSDNFRGKKEKTKRFAWGGRANQVFFFSTKTKIIKDGYRVHSPKKYANEPQGPRISSKFTTGWKESKPSEILPYISFNTRVVR